MYLMVIITSLLGSSLSGFFGRSIGISGSQLVTIGLVISAGLIAIATLIEISIYSICTSLYLFKWLSTESLNVYWSFNLDSLTGSMLIPVLIISTLVHLYSVGYMDQDPHNQRFFSYLSLFTFMMLILVAANNYLLMFVGWEGVGICSYLLVSFWFTRIAANQSSISAMLTNRVGDCLLTVGMFAILWTIGNLDYTTVFSLSSLITESQITIIGVCLLIGAMAKSSQVGLHVWLPMAMEGPTPVSALIHAATMVTAGVYLLVRSSPLIEYSTTVLLLCLWIGAITTLFSSLIGLFQQDIKKVIAYSTMSQLGLMVVAIGLSSYNVALFHLVNHAFYKALLFLGAGAIIHGVADNQDFRKYGGFKTLLPLSYSVMLIASLSLVAFPFMAGFFSKDFILESCYGGFDPASITAYYISTIGAMFTTLYSVKTLHLVFFTNPNGALINYKNVHEGNIYISSPLIILALFSIYLGYAAREMFIGLGTNLFIDNSIFIHPANEIMINTEFAVSTIFKLLPFALTISMIFISILVPIYLFKDLIYFKLSRFGYNMFSFLALRFLIELIYNKYITENILKFGGQTTRVLDKGAVELIGPYGLETELTTLSKNLSPLDNQLVTSYALFIVVGGISYISIAYLIIIAENLLIVLLIIPFSIISYYIASELYAKYLSLPLVNKNYIKSVQHQNVLKSSLLEHYYNVLFNKDNTVQKYWRNLSLSRLILGVIKLKIVSLSIAYVLCLDIVFNNDVIPLNIIFTQDVNILSIYIIILFIIIYFILTPLRNKINYSKTLIYNFIIVNTIIFLSMVILALVLYIFKINIDNINSCYLWLPSILTYLLHLNSYEFIFINDGINPPATDAPSLNSDIMFKGNATQTDSSNNTVNESNNSGSTNTTDDFSRPFTPTFEKQITMTYEELAEYTNGIIADSYKLDGINKTPPTLKIEKLTLKDGKVSTEQTASSQTCNEDTSSQNVDNDRMDTDSAVANRINSKGYSLALYDSENPSLNEQSPMNTEYQDKAISDSKSSSNKRPITSENSSVSKRSK